MGDFLQLGFGIDDLRQPRPLHLQQARRLADAAPGLEQRPADALHLDFVPPKGESLRSLGVRVRSCCEEWTERARTETVVFVTHVSPIKAAVAWALGGTDTMAWRMFVAPASIVRINIADHGPVLMTFGEQPPDVG